MDCRTKVSMGGRVVLPAKLRRAAGIDIGDEVIIKLVEGRLMIFGRSEGVSLAQAKVRRFLSGKGSLAEELVADRRRDSRNE